jgi:hypothetical protein
MSISISVHTNQQNREYKVSLFAQELKTPYPVSPKKINQLIDEIEKL